MGRSINTMTVDELERRHKDTQAVTKTLWNPNFNAMRNDCQRINVEPIVTKKSGPGITAGDYGGTVHTYKVSVAGLIYYVDLLPWLGFDQIRSCIICRHDESNTSSDSGHYIDKDDYCVACRRMSARILANLAKRMAERDSKTVLENKS